MPSVPEELHRNSVELARIARKVSTYFHVEGEASNDGNTDLDRKLFQKITRKLSTIFGGETVQGPLTTIQEDEFGVSRAEPSLGVKFSPVVGVGKVTEQSYTTRDASSVIPTFTHEGASKKKKAPRGRGGVVAAMQSQHHVHLLNTLQLVGITFFAVAGGPYGFEPTVAAGGPVLMLVGLLLFPFLWSAPLALMTAELSCMIPESGGHVLWVYRAFGPFWSFVNSCFAFACSVLDNAMYPVLFVDYLSALFYEGEDRIPYTLGVFIKIFILVIVTILNIVGVDIVGFASIVLGVSVMAPFLAMCVLGLLQLNFDWTDNIGPDVVDWSKFLTMILWNTSGFDAAGTCASEVRNPGHAYPRALAVSLALIVAMYGLPTIIGVSFIPDYKLWKDGTYILVAKIIGGPALKNCRTLEVDSMSLKAQMLKLGSSITGQIIS